MVYKKRKRPFAGSGVCSGRTEPCNTGRAAREPEEGQVPQG